MALRRMWDAAFPPASPPRWEVAAGYIGGGTPHIWTDAEWAATETRWRLPIFVRVPPTSHDPRDDAALAIRWLGAHKVPKDMTLALDYETAIDATYLAAFDRAVMAAGWRVMVYGTRRTVLQNPKPSGGYWDAQWTNVPHLNAGSAATQYGGDTTLGQPYDASLVADSTPLWDTKEDTLTTEEHDALMWLRTNAATHSDIAVVIRGDETTDPTKDTHPDNIGRTRQDLAAGLSAVATRLDAIVNRLDSGPSVTLDPEQLAELKQAVTLEGSALIQLAVSPPIAP
jgi:hypothetical protein